MPNETAFTLMNGRVALKDVVQFTGAVLLAAGVWYQTNDALGDRIDKLELSTSEHPGKEHAASIHRYQQLAQDVTALDRRTDQRLDAFAGDVGAVRDEVGKVQSDTRVIRTRQDAIREAITAEEARAKERYKALEEKLDFLIQRELESGGSIR